MNSELSKKLFKLIVGTFVFTVLLNQFIGWAITEKPWHEQLWVTVAAAGGLGSAGAVLGLLIGGMGLVLGGGAIGLAGWLVFGLLGFGVGALGGSLYTILESPQNFDFDIFRLSILLIVSAFSALIVVLYTSKIGIKILTYLKKQDSED